MCARFRIFEKGTISIRQGHKVDVSQGVRAGAQSGCVPGCTSRGTKWMCPRVYEQGHKVDVPQGVHAAWTQKWWAPGCTHTWALSGCAPVCTHRGMKWMCPRVYVQKQSGCAGRVYVQGHKVDVPRMYRQGHKVDVPRMYRQGHNVDVLACVSSIRVKSYWHHCKLEIALTVKLNCCYVLRELRYKSRFLRLAMQVSYDTLIPL